MSILSTLLLHRAAGVLANVNTGRALSMQGSLTLLTLLLLTLLTSAGCADRGPGNVRTVPPGTPATFVKTCSPCSDACVYGKRKQCIEGKVYSGKAKSGGCLVYCIGRPETVGKTSL